MRPKYSKSALEKTFRIDHVFPAAVTIMAAPSDSQYRAVSWTLNSHLNAGVSLPPLSGTEAMYSPRQKTAMKESSRAVDLFAVPEVKADVCAIIEPYRNKTISQRPIHILIAPNRTKLSTL